MKISVLRYAVDEFNRLKEEFAPAIETLGLTALVALVRQRYMDTDRGWHFFEIGLEELLEPSPDGPGEYAFWGRLVEGRGGRDKQVKIILDPAGIDSVEFEIYDEIDDQNS